MWRVVFDERTRIPVHDLYEHYRLEDLERIHAWLDAFDVLNAAREKKQKAKEAREAARR